MKQRLIPVFVIWLLAVPSLLPAQIYRYTDSSGTIHYTDNLMKVPESQRSRYPLSDSETPGQTNPPPGDERRLVPEKTGEVEGSVLPPDIPKDADPLVEMDRLQQMKLSMDQEYASLLKEQLSLAALKNSLSTSAEIDAYNQKVIEVNLRVDEYEKKRTTFETERDRFQRWIQDRMGKKPEENLPLSSGD